MVDEGLAPGRPRYIIKGIREVCQAVAFLFKDVIMRHCVW